MTETIHTEPVSTTEYKGRKIVIELRPPQRISEYSRFSTPWYLAHINEVRHQGNSSLNGETADKALKAAKHSIDVTDADDTIRPNLVPLVASEKSYETLEGQGFRTADEGVEVGDIAWIYSRGQYRRGLVEKVGKTNVTVAYTTVGACEQVEKHGYTARQYALVTRKADKFANVYVERTEEEKPAQDAEELPVVDISNPAEWEHFTDSVTGYCETCKGECKLTAREVGARRYAALRDAAQAEEPAVIVGGDGGATHADCDEDDAVGDLSDGDENTCWICGEPVNQVDSEEGKGEEELARADIALLADTLSRSIYAHSRGEGQILSTQEELALSRALQAYSDHAGIPRTAPGV